MYDDFVSTLTITGTIDVYFVCDFTAGDGCCSYDCCSKIDDEEVTFEESLIVSGGGVAGIIM